jgi:hypothetical protein
MESNCVKIVLKENVEKALRRPDLNMFVKNLRRAEEYDTEECPERWKSAIEYVKAHGVNHAELLKRFGERELKNPKEDLERMISVYNYAIRNGAVYGAAPSTADENKKNQMALTLPFWCRETEPEIVDVLRKTGSAELFDRWNPGRKDCDFLTLDDKLSGTSLIFIEYKPNWDAEIYVIPQEQPAGKFLTFNIGKANITDLFSVGKRRFMYIFGCVPAEDNDVIHALALLNNLPKPGDEIRTLNDRYAVYYRLEERTLDKLPHSEGVRLIFDEAQEAKSHGLFADVKVYELVGEKHPIPVRDPVIIGIDHFGHKYPVVYWMGDKGFS